MNAPILGKHYILNHCAVLVFGLVFIVLLSVRKYNTVGVNLKLLQLKSKCSRHYKRYTWNLSIDSSTSNYNVTFCSDVVVTVQS